MIKEISCRITARMLRWLSSGGIDMSLLTEDTGRDLDHLLNKDKWISTRTPTALLANSRRVTGREDISRELGRSMVEDGLLGEDETDLFAHQSPESLIQLLCERYSELHRSLSFDIKSDGKRKAFLYVRYQNPNLLTRDLCEFVTGILDSIAAKIDLRNYRLIEKECAVPPRRLGRFGNSLMRIDDSGSIMLYKESKKLGSGRARIAGRLADDGTMTLDGVRFGTGKCLYQLVWRKPTFLSRSGGLTKSQRLRNLSEGLGKAKTTISTVNRRMSGVAKRLNDQKMLTDAINGFIVDAKRIGTLMELLNTVAVKTCSDFGFDRACVYLVKVDNLEVVNFYDPSDSEWAQRIYAVVQAHPLALDGPSPEAEVVRTGKALAVNDAWKESRISPNLLEAWKTKAYAVVPIYGREKVIALLWADHYYKKREISGEDIDKLLMFSSAIGLAMEKVTVIRSLEEKVEERTKALSNANKNLTQLYQKSRESDETKSTFLANMSHELRTPLNSIIGFSKVLLQGMDGEINDVQQQDIQVIHQSGIHLLNLINDILDLSKIESGKMQLHKEHFDLNELTHGVMDVVAPQAREKSLTLNTDLDERLPFLYADKTRIRQVLLNLLSNAVKFTATGTVAVSTKIEDGHVHVAVSDTGVGMKKEDIEKAFVEFQQVGSSSRGGSGLGLTISRKFVEMHQGRMWVSSRVGLGSTFHFTIPLSS